MSTDLPEISSFGNTKPKKSDKSDCANRLTYDAAFKRFFRRVSVLAVLLKEIVPEFKDMHPHEIEKYIKKDVNNPILAHIRAGESLDSGSKIVYDMIIDCDLPEGTISARIVFDLEMQRKYNMKYQIVDRATYYASTLLACQSVAGSSYQNLAPVYSTWICMVGENSSLANTVHSFRIRDNSADPIDLDKSLINIDLLILSEKYDWDESDAAIVKFLQAIFKNEMSDARFNPYLEVNTDMSRELEAIRFEEEQYLAEMNEYKEEVMAEAIIETAQSLGVHDAQQIAELVAKQMNLSQDEALSIVKEALKRSAEN